MLKMYEQFKAYDAALRFAALLVIKSYCLCQTTPDEVHVWMNSNILRAAVKTAILAIGRAYPGMRLAAPLHLCSLWKMVLFYQMYMLDNKGPAWWPLAAVAAIAFMVV